MSFEIEQFRVLLALQEHDTGIASAERRLAAARTGEELEPLRQRLTAVETRLSELGAKLSALRRDLRYAEQENQDVRAEIGGHEKRLYSGVVRNPKEAEQLQNYVHSLRRRLNDGQEKALGLMLEIEPLEPEAAEAQRQFDEARAELDTAEKELGRVTGELESELPKLREERARLSAALPPGLLGPYEALRSRRPGAVVVAVVEGGKCTGCRVALPFMTVREARAGTLRTCDNCGRILVVP